MQLLVNLIYCKSAYMPTNIHRKLNILTAIDLFRFIIGIGSETDTQTDRRAKYCLSQPVGLGQIKLIMKIKLKQKQTFSSVQTLRVGTYKYFARLSVCLRVCFSPDANYESI